jgi:choline dehydrogenase
MLLFRSPARALHADTVVVGAGSAGAVIAARVTERSDRDVLLVEAGPDYPDREDLPEDLRNGGKNSMILHDWGYTHRPTRGAWIRHMFPRGRVVGGSSAVNTCIALRPRPYDLEEWAARGLPDWTWERCLPALKRLERDLDFGHRTDIHGADGPLPIRRHRPAELVPWQAAFLEACSREGFARCEDHNDPAQTGAGPHAMNKIDGRRVSVAEAYLGPSVRARENLRVLARTVVRRVVFERGRARGLEVETDGVLRTVEAKTIVLSAGAVGTLAILLRSGIGPRADLDRLGVELVRDVPAVGARLLDHPGSAIFFRPRDPSLLRLDDPLIQCLCRWTSKGSPLPDDMQVQPGSLVPFPRHTFRYFSLMCSVGKPSGHGTIRFASARIDAKPRIVSDMLGHADDRRKLLEAVRLDFRLGTSAPMAELAEPFWPRKDVFRDDDALLRALEQVTGSGYHPCGTVPMGEAVDGRGRFDGIEGLVVADASLMPTVPSANTNLTAILIGERFGEWLRDGGL